ncbi:chitin deacetylase [Actinomortierella wolfii]|nr:chitin deacetylase [Actinomortierella wolfii]
MVSARAIAPVSSSESSLSSIDYHGIVSTHRHVQGVGRLEQGGQVTKLDISKYPPKDSIPDVNSAQVQQWIKEIDWSKVPDIAVNKGLPTNRYFPLCSKDESYNRKICHWSCGDCVREDDILTCPTQGEWAITFDDGPSNVTRDLLKYLKERQFSATFFLVGSRVLENPDILKEQIEQGHHLAMHTWSHQGLTTLTNHEIVAEVKWTEKVIQDVTGLKMKYIRPPFGDMDDRVRAVLREMGYKVVIWSQGWDSHDWKVMQHVAKVSEVVNDFTSALNNLQLVKSPTGVVGGPITLEHDMTSGSIELAMKMIPMGEARGLKPMSLAKCFRDETPYQGNNQITQHGVTAPKNATESADKGHDESIQKSAAGSQPKGSGASSLQQPSRGATAGLALLVTGASYLLLVL